MAEKIPSDVWKYIVDFVDREQQLKKQIEDLFQVIEDADVKAEQNLNLYTDHMSQLASQRDYFEREVRRLRRRVQHLSAEKYSLRDENNILRERLDMRPRRDISPVVNRILDFTEGSDETEVDSLSD